MFYTENYTINVRSSSRTLSNCIQVCPCALLLIPLQSFTASVINPSTRWKCSWKSCSSTWALILFVLPIVIPAGKLAVKSAYPSVKSHTPPLQGTQHLRKKQQQHTHTHWSSASGSFCERPHCSQFGERRRSAVWQLNLIVEPVGQQSRPPLCPVFFYSCQCLFLNPSFNIETGAKVLKALKN